MVEAWALVMVAVAVDEEVAGGAMAGGAMAEAAVAEGAMVEGLLMV